MEDITHTLKWGQRKPVLAGKEVEMVGDPVPVVEIHRKLIMTSVFTHFVWSLRQLLLSVEFKSTVLPPVVYFITVVWFIMDSMQYFWVDIIRAGYC